MLEGCSIYNVNITDANMNVVLFLKRKYMFLYKYYKKIVFIILMLLGHGVRRKVLSFRHQEQRISFTRQRTKIVLCTGFHGFRLKALKVDLNFAIRILSLYYI